MKLPMRQIHLDFHTSEMIGGVGADFDAARFADTLKAANVNSVTLFSRCHHGWIYHDTKFEHLRHPHLECNLLAEQIEACHAAGIAAPIYITVGWDERAAREHPEWREYHPDGRLAGAGPLDAGWKTLCFNTPYIDFVIEQTEEVMVLFPVDGIFFDIMLQGPCCCTYCLGEMLARGIDPTDAAARSAFAHEVLDRAKRRIFAAVRKHSHAARVFFNAGHIGPYIRSSLDTYTHLELESLPSGGWGYMHFPVTVRYARKLGLPTLSVTGKFHITWGHFSSFKHPAALEYEALVGPANCAATSIGDQLHPRGVLCEETYARIGRVYGLIKEREPWYEDAEPVTEVAVYNTEACLHDGIRIDPSITGTTRALLEGAHQFDIVDGEMDWSPYSVVVLPDVVTLDEALAAKVSAYLAGGGAVLATGRSGLAADGSGFALPEWPVAYVGPARINPDFVEVFKPLSHDMPGVPFVAYEPGLETRLRDGAEVLASTHLPYFPRSFEHFCSHFHAPIEKQAGYPSAARLGRIVYLAHPHFAAYAKHGATEDAQIARNALDLLLPRPLVRSDAPSTCHITLSRQADRRRWIAHLLHYIPERRSDGRDMIQDIIPLRAVRLEVRTLSAPSACYVAPSTEKLACAYEDGYAKVTVPEVGGTAMVVFEGVG